MDWNHESHRGFDCSRLVSMASCALQRDTWVICTMNRSSLKYVDVFGNSIKVVCGCSLSVEDLKITQRAVGLSREEICGPLRL